MTFALQSIIEINWNCIDCINLILYPHILISEVPFKDAARGESTPLTDSKIVTTDHTTNHLIIILFESERN